MSSNMPPVPPASRSPKGPGGTAQPQADTAPHNTVPQNLEQQDRQGNIKQNTTHQGYQQDR
jgi:hypothetical protein